MIYKFLLLSTVLFTMTNCKSNTNKTQTPTIPKQSQFRNIYWDMTKEEVLINETATQNKLLADTTSLLFTNIDLFGKKFDLGYAFDSSKLKRAIYYTELTALENIQNLYLVFKNSLIEKYGKPQADELIWKGTMLSLPEEKRDWYVGLISNELYVASIWKDSLTFPNRVISLDIQNLDGKIIIKNMNCEIDYYRKLKIAKNTQTLNNL